MDDLDLRDLFQELWIRKFLVAGAAAAGLALSSVYAFFIAPTTFVSTSVLLPTQSSAPDQLSAATALLGRKSSSTTDLELYQSLLTSRSVLHKLLTAPIHCEDNSCKGRTLPLYAILGIDPKAPLQLEAATALLKGSVNVASNSSNESGLLEVSLEASTPWLAQQIGNRLIETGQEEMRLIRAARADIVLAKLSLAVEQARNEWEAVAHAYAAFKDRNRSIALPAQFLELSRYEMEKSAKEQKYLLARKEYEALVLEREKAVPPMMVLDSADLPARKAKPKRTLLMLLGLMGGGFLSSVTVMARKALFIRSQT